jgi:hypothetical protein
LIEDVLIDSVSWTRMRSVMGSSEFVPEAIKALLNAATEEQAESAYWRLDNRVVVQGQLFESAQWVIAPLLLGLVSNRPGFVRQNVANLLVEIAVGEPDETELSVGNELLGAQCRAELKGGLWVIYALLDDPLPMVRLGALDLLDVVEDNRTRLASAVSHLRSDQNRSVAKRASELIRT